jgi:PAS domain S-box-containing protein
MSKRSIVLSFAAGAAILVGLYLLSRKNYLLFHSLAEVFSVVIAFSIFILAWNSRRVMENSYLLLLGIAYLFVGGLDIVHTLAYTGMGVFPGQTTDLATKLWIAARYMESLSLLLALLFLGRRLRVEILLLGYGSVSLFLIVCIFYCGAFPTCFVEGQGLTVFKKVSEYIIALILLGSIAGLVRERTRFDPDVLRLVIASILLTVASELAFTFYIDAYGLSNLIGHYFKIISFYLIYKAIIETGLKKPYDLLFRELKQREQALRLSEQAYRAIFENTGTATVMIEEDTTISLVNSEFEKLSGYSKEEVEGKKRWGFFLKDEDLKEMQRYHEGRRLGDESVPRDYDFRVVDRFGTEKAVHMTVSLIPGTMRSVASAMDITERHRAEEIIRRDKETLGVLVRERTDELLKAYRRLAEARRLSGIGTLAATVAHELRNPLGVIRLAVINVRRKSREPALDKHLNNIEKKISESDRIISNLLRYSNIKTPQLESADLRDILNECIQSTEKRFPDRKTKVSAHLDDIGGVQVELDVVQMKEVFDNILNNAYQAVTDTGGRISLTALMGRDGEIEVVVKDDGAGIGAEDLKMVFEPFFTTKTRGTGLGLTICRELVRLHGGDIEIASRPGSGTTVTVRLPTGGRSRSRPPRGAGTPPTSDLPPASDSPPAPGPPPTPDSPPASDLPPATDSPPAPDLPPASDSPPAPGQSGP